MRGLWMLAAAVLCSVTASAQPVIEVGAYEVTATGLTPGSPSYWVGLGRAFRSARPALLQWQLSIVADPGGRAVLGTPNGVPKVSMWCVVDGATGEVAVVSPSESASLQKLDVESALVREKSGQPVGLDLPARELTVLVVRKGGGAWLERLADGGNRDRDLTADGVVGTRFSDLKPLGTAPQAPETIGTLDTVVAIDVEDFRFWVIEPQAVPAGSGSER